ncbi:TetR/AcrR family transcriptional regulator [Cohnella sp. REN36]|uniref:TetR/AcrR family transcriptional regulator n=1 Tax=Cohnella sp. REN36 TaxID=2887347 RepID=UPI001D1348F6|nr:TetR/AcrR family transcriptional regulator [Cohnella sp. REN36]MCC3372738.1 TetR/AcrR family transcriptional regulator [Cohnella sp. REN36]
MTKGEQTRERIIAESAELFNRRGYAGASLSDIIERTGIQKGGIYRHFGSKDEIALEAYGYATGVVGARIRETMAERASASEKLLAYFDVYRDVAESPPFAGGCPLLNTAVESDDGHPALRDRARQSMANTLESMKRIIAEGIRSGEFRPDLDADALAGFALASMEGSIMMSKLEGSNRHIRTNRDSFAAYLERYCRRSSQT